MKMRHLPVLPEFPRPLLFAHRGLNRKYLENSMESFEAAFNAGVPGIELDVHLTADDKLVIFHDDTTSRIEQKIQPEEIHLYSTTTKVRANWEVDVELEPIEKK